MDTITGTTIPEYIRGVLYICDFSDRKELQVVNTILFDSVNRAIEAYCEIPNPESQLVVGNDYESLCKNLEIQHSLMKNKLWLKQLYESI